VTANPKQACWDVSRSSSGELKLANIFKKAPEIRVRGDAHGSISVQERQPNLTFSRFGVPARLDSSCGSRRFRKHIKGLVEGDGEFAVVPFVTDAVATCTASERTKAGLYHRQTE